MIAQAADGDPVVGGLIVCGFGIVALVAVARDRHRAPNLPCRRCKGRGRRSWFRSQAWGVCPRCGGKPRQRRL